MELKHRALIIRIAGSLLAAGAIGAGQAGIFAGRYQAGLLWTLTGLALVAGVWVIPPALWGQVGRALWEALTLSGRLFRDLFRRRAAEAPRAAQASAGRGRKAGPRFQALAAPLRFPSLLDRWRNWAPFQDDSLEIPRVWLAYVGMSLLLVAGGMVMSGRLIMGLLVLLTGLLPFAAYAQDPAQPIRLNNLNRVSRYAALVLLGFLPQLFSGKLLWDYKYVMTGTVLTTLFVSWQLWALRPLADLRPLSTAEWRRSGAWQPGDRWWVKALLVAAAALLAWVSRILLNQIGYLGSVILDCVAIALLMLSFPWFKGSLATLPWLSPPLRSLLAGLGAVGAFALALRAQDLMNTGHMQRSLWLFLLAGIVLVLSLPSSSQQEQGPSEAPSEPLPDLKAPPKAQPTEAPRAGFWDRRLEILLFIGLLLIGAGLRIWKVDIFPWTAEGDEAGGGLWALWALKGQVDNPLIHQNLPLGFTSVSSAVFHYFGVGVGQLRAHAVIFGVLSLASFYFFCRLFWGWKTAFLASMALSFGYWHLHYSRFGHFNIEQVFAQTVAYYFLFKAERTGAYRWAVAGGVAFALAMMPHMAGRLLPFSMILYFVYLLLYRRDLVVRRWVHYTAFVLAAWMVLSPALIFWTRASAYSMGRAKSVSVFDKTNTNAPRDPVIGIVENTRLSLLMFNWLGDTRHRNNPVAPKQIVEPKTAALLFIAFLFVAYHWRDPLNLFLLACFWVNLAASIFSVEAPQTLRSAGNITIVFALIGVLFSAFKRSLEGLGRRTAFVIAVVLLVPLTGWFSWRSFRAYFIESRNLAYDVMPTLVSQEAGKRSGKDYIMSFWATGFVQSHPPVELFKLDTPLESHADLIEALPFRDRLDRNRAIALCDEYRLAEPYVRELYPGATSELLSDIRPGFLGQPLAVIMDIPKEEVAKTLGLKLRAWPRDGGAPVDLGQRAPRVAVADADLQAFQRFEWKGTLFVRDYGQWKFWPQTVGNATLWIDGRQVASSRGGTVQAESQLMAKGLHTVRVLYERPRAPEGFAIMGEARPHRPNFIHNLRAGVTGAVPDESWFAWESAPGLNGTYFLSDNWTGEVAVQVIQPQLLFHYLDPPFGGRWSAEWNGDIRIDQEGLYQFKPVASGYFEVEVDGRLVHRSGSPLRPELNPRPVQAAQLRPGWHRLRLRFVTQGSLHLDFRWSGPGIIGEAMVPAGHLRPRL